VDSKLCDAQAGYESLLTALIPALAGANLVYGTGMLDSGMVLDYGKMVMDDEINHQIKRIVKGMLVDDTTLSVDLIKEVGLTGDYLVHPSTLRLFKQLSAPKLMNRESYENWTAGGSTDLHQRALQQARELVANHQSPPISEQARREIDEIIRETEKELGIIT
jgi:trimethylamine--corrinoid protein Co-methyltransferase